MKLDTVLLGIDRVSAAVGKVFAWCILLLTLAVSYEVFARYLFGRPTTWAFDASYMLYGALFMGAGAYTLSRNGHVRGDFVYRNFAPRRQAALDLVLYVLFFFPGMIAFVYAGWNYFHLSYILNELSPFSPRGLPVWPLKFMIPFVGALMILQGIAETTRCILCLRTGRWPNRLKDVEEIEKILIEQRAQAEAGR